MDIKMPRKTGFEVLEWVKGNSTPVRRIPVVIVSSSDNPSDINRAYELGANAYMVKPMDFRAVEHLFAKHYVNAPVQRVHVSPPDWGVPAIGHSGFFDPKVCPARIWRSVAEWMGNHG